MDIPSIEAQIVALQEARGKQTCHQATLAILSYLGNHLNNILSDNLAVSKLTEQFRTALMEPSTDPAHVGSFPNQTYKKFLFSIVHYIENGKIPVNFLPVSVIFFMGILEESTITGIIPVERRRNQKQMTRLNQLYGLSLDTTVISNSHIVFLLQAILAND